VSSIGGRQGNAGLSIYQAAKFGVCGFSEALAVEVVPLGIFVTSLEPGAMDTDWGKSSMSYTPEVEGYEKSVGALVAVLQQFAGMETKHGGDPKKIAKLIIKITDNPAPPVHLVVGKDAYKMVHQGELKKLDEMDKWKNEGDATDYDADFTLFDSEGKTPLN
jgi:NAD(P)-dependent dehydrogenase (short-subunit alcohol dehydrogenase family)